MHGRLIGDLYHPDYAETTNDRFMGAFTQDAIRHLAAARAIDPLRTQE